MSDDDTQDREERGEVDGLEERRGRQNPFPGGLLVLAPDGHIIEAPRFFLDALEVEERDAPSIYHLFDRKDPPSLRFTRIYRRPNGVLEYHVVVDTVVEAHYGFRYWHISPAQSRRSRHPSTFYIVDESPVLRGQEWTRRRLRRELRVRAREAMTTHLRERVGTLQLLAETLRDRPDEAHEAAERLLDAIEELGAGVEGLLSDLPGEGEESAGRLYLEELPQLVRTWGVGLRQVRVHTYEEPALEGRLSYELVERVLYPVVQNALEATGARGVVDVDIAPADEGSVRIDVRDQGSGMSELEREHAEDPFFTTKSGRMGMGLPRAFEALNQAGGSWRIESVEGAGTCVTIVIPVS